MCGRFILTSDGQIIREMFGLAGLVELRPRYNIAPSTNIAAVRALEGGDGRQLDHLRWGLIPPWAKDKKYGFRTINARAETAATKPSFRSAFKRRRCLIPADGFYEWKKRDGAKIPHLIRLASERPFAMAGLWERWTDPEGDPIESCTILTTEANALVADLHDRMPVILDPTSYERWLDPNESDRDSLQELLVPFPAERMAYVEVSPLVNNVRNDDPACVEPRSGVTSVDSG